VPAAISIHIATHALSLWLVVVLGTVMIASVDYFTGVELRVYPLYYAPISLVAWYRGRSSVLIAAPLCALVWFGSNFLAGLRFSHPDLWVANTLVQGASFAVVGLLINTLRASLAREREVSRTDPLTSLRNSRAFYEEASRMLASCRRHRRPITLAYIDLDNFKAVNDTLGHEAGDELLRRIADQLHAAIRPSDLLARLGGDEFALLLPEVGPPEAAVTLERLQSSLTGTRASISGPATMSIGAVSFVSVPDDVEQMIRRADAGMDEAKTTGKNRIHLVVAGDDGSRTTVR
jgi:diguanylate cyclase (GGDEF)-like protein